MKVPSLQVWQEMDIRLGFYVSSLYRIDYVLYVKTRQYIPPEFTVLAFISKRYFVILEQSLSKLKNWYMGVINHAEFNSGIRI